jgi:hypothetical protein
MCKPQVMMFSIEGLTFAEAPPITLTEIGSLAAIKCRRVA